VKLSNLVYGAVGYTLGARAGRGRYEQIVRLARRTAASRTGQATAATVRAQVERVRGQAKQAVAAKLGGSGA
jgi:hypothetical protein